MSKSTSLSQRKSSSFGQRRSSNGHRICRHVCVMYLYHGSVSCICVMYLCYVSCICITYLCEVSVWGICVWCIVYLYHVSVSCIYVMYMYHVSVSCICIMCLCHFSFCCRMSLTVCRRRLKITWLKWKVRLHLFLLIAQNSDFLNETKISFLSLLSNIKASLWIHIDFCGCPEAMSLNLSDSLLLLHNRKQLFNYWMIGLSYTAQVSTHWP